MSKSANARVKGIAWNTVHRWLERASVWCRRFDDRKIKGLSVVELQGRRNQNDRREQGTANLGLRRDRGVVSTLAFDRGRQTELPEHLVPLSRGWSFVHRPTSYSRSSVHQRSCLANASGGLATLDDGSAHSYAARQKAIQD